MVAKTRGTNKTKRYKPVSADWLVSRLDEDQHCCDQNLIFNSNYITPQIRIFHTVLTIDTKSWTKEWKVKLIQTYTIC